MSPCSPWGPWATTVTPASGCPVEASETTPVNAPVVASCAKARPATSTSAKVTNADRVIRGKRLFVPGIWDLHPLGFGAHRIQKSGGASTTMSAPLKQSLNPGLGIGCGYTTVSWVTNDPGWVVETALDSVPGVGDAQAGNQFMDGHAVQAGPPGRPRNIAPCPFEQLGQ